MKTTTKIKIIIVLIALINLILFITWGKSLLKDYKKYSNQIYELGTMDEQGSIGVTVKYTNEPVNITLISPSGKEINRKEMDEYEIDEKNKTITAWADTKELGKWKLKLNQKSNRTIRYTFSKKKSRKIHLEQTSIAMLNDMPHIVFTPVMSTENCTTCTYSMLLANTQHAFILNSGETMLNKKACIAIDPDEAAFNDETYQLKLTVTSLDKEIPSSDTKELNVLLPKLTISENDIVSENEIDKEETGEEDD